MHVCRLHVTQQMSVPVWRPADWQVLRAARGMQQCSCAASSSNASSLVGRRSTLLAIGAGAAALARASGSYARSMKPDAVQQQRQESEEAAFDVREGEVHHPDADWRKQLTGAQYRILRKAGTELPLSSPLNKEKRNGSFLCAGCGAPVFASNAKFDSGTGWPSFWQPVDGAVEERLDRSIPFLPRQEVRCKQCQGHLGHVFTDGPPPTGLRYCMNGAAMTFKPQDA